MPRLLPFGQADVPIDQTNILFLNVQSLHKNFKMLPSLPYLNKAGLLIFRETWLNENDMSREYTIEGYQLHRFDFPATHPQRPHAGVAIYSQLSQPEPRLRTWIHNSVQFVEIRLPKFRVIAVHRRPSVTTLSGLSVSLSSLLDDSEPTLFIGDFNVDNTTVTSLKTKFHNRNFRSCITTTTTNSNTALDHVYCNFDVLCFTTDCVFSFHKPLMIYDKSP